MSTAGGKPVGGHYARGTRLERAVVKDLFTNGYTTCRAAGSKGGTGADVLGFKPTQMLLVACRLSGVLSPDEWNRLLEVSRWYAPFAIPVIASGTPTHIAYRQILGPVVKYQRDRPARPFVIDFANTGKALEKGAQLSTTADVS